MKRRLLRWLGAALVGAACLLPAAPALAQASATPDTEKEGRGPPVFQALVAFVSILVVLVIVCMPSRKA